MDGKVEKKRRGILLFFMIFLIIAVSSQGDAQEGIQGNLRPGSMLPRILFRASSPEDSRYLGIGKKKVFTFQDISAEVLLVDYINTNCSNCNRSAPIFVELHRKIEEDFLLRGKVKIIAIGAGDTQTEVNSFKGNFKIPFPIFPDEEYKAHDAVGAPRVPFLVIARRGSQWKWVVVDTRLGMIDEDEYKSTTYLEEDWLVLKAEGGISSLDGFLEELRGILSTKGEPDRSKGKKRR